MPDLSTLYPQMAPLQGVAAGLMQGSMFNTAQQNEGINQAGALQNMFKTQQTLPYVGEEARLKNEHTQALIDSTKAGTAKTQQEFDFAKRLEDSKYTAAISKYAAEADENELKLIRNKIQRDLYSPDKAVSDRAMKMFLMTDDVLKEREKIKLQGQNKLDVASVQSAGRAGAPVVDRTSLAARLAGAKGNPRATATILATHIASLAEDDPERSKLIQMYNAAAEQAATQESGRLGLTQTPDGKLVPRTQVTVPAAPGGGWKPPAGWSAQ